MVTSDIKHHRLPCDHHCTYVTARNGQHHSDYSTHSEIARRQQCATLPPSHTAPTSDNIQWAKGRSSGQLRCLRQVTAGAASSDSHRRAGRPQAAHTPGLRLPAGEEAASARCRAGSRSQAVIAMERSRTRGGAEADEEEGKAAAAAAAGAAAADET